MSEKVLKRTMFGFLVFWACIVLINLTLWGAAIYVAIHFILKLW